MPIPINTDFRTKQISLDIASGLLFLMKEVENDKNHTVFLALPRILQSNRFILKTEFLSCVHFLCLGSLPEYTE